MDFMKTIETPRLILDALQAQDAEAIFTLFSHDDVLEFYDIEKFTSLNQAYDVIEKMSNRFNTQQGFRYAIRLKSGTLIGSFGTNRILLKDDQYGALIGYDLHPQYWQQGYMSEVLSQILFEFKENLLFSKKINFVVAEVYPQNEKSIQLLLKHGFQQIEDNNQEQLSLDLELSSRLIFKLVFE